MEITYNNDMIPVNQVTKINKNLIGYKFWYSNGQLMKQYTCLNDRIHGEYFYWHKNGDLYMHFEFLNGEVIKNFRNKQD